MENEHVLSGLIRKRAEIGGALEAAQQRVRQLIIDIDNVDATIRIFAPDIDLEEIRPKPLPPRHAAFKGEIGRAIMDALCGTGEALTTKDITLQVMAARDLNAADPHNRICVHFASSHATYSGETASGFGRLASDPCEVTKMQSKLLFAAALGTMMLPAALASAQVPGTNLGTTQTQPQPGGGVAAGPGAPTSAARLAPGGGSPVEARGAPPAGAGAAVAGGPGTGATTPNGAIRPGTSSPGGTGGSSSN